MVFFILPPPESDFAGSSTLFISAFNSARVLPNSLTDVWFALSVILAISASVAFIASDSAPTCIEASVRTFMALFISPASFLAKPGRCTIPASCTFFCSLSASVNFCVSSTLFRVSALIFSSFIWSSILCSKSRFPASNVRAKSSWPLASSFTNLRYSGYSFFNSAIAIFRCSSLVVVSCIIETRALNSLCWLCNSSDKGVLKRSFTTERRLLNASTTVFTIPPPDPIVANSCVKLSTKLDKEPSNVCETAMAAP